MKPKSVWAFFLIFLFASSSILSSAQARTAQRAPAPRQVLPSLFNKAVFYVTPQIGINSWSIPFGANVEYALQENIGVGGTAMFWTWGDQHWSNTVIAISADGAYHFTKLKVEKLDLFAGAAIGFSIYSWKWKSGFEDFGDGASGSSGIYLQPFVAGRYYLSPKIAASLRLNIGLGTWAGVGAVIGVTLSL